MTGLRDLDGEIVVLTKIADRLMMRFSWGDQDAVSACLVIATGSYAGEHDPTMLVVNRPVVRILASYGVGALLIGQVRTFETADGFESVTLDRPADPGPAWELWCELHPGVVADVV